MSEAKAELDDRKHTKLIEIRSAIQREIDRIPPADRLERGQLTVNRALVSLLADALIRIEVLEKGERTDGR